ncbi:hypothetical protein TSOC_007385 [Tetrabaena socialis]|uniref:GATA-type domain-containing protein n=1 Tax=Tetrabaena socialis TaxID=47790 RepID=A0A2J8A167_9CHLO|nr:hypothetical protein TSOC_007385 [Tetrabaena socialis]|eukprot:PNH06260.1 hypothetical protein TSOC_007385 [Tetrabaena socialis]
MSLIGWALSVVVARLLSWLRYCQDPAAGQPAAADADQPSTSLSAASLARDAHVRVAILDLNGFLVPGWPVAAGVSKVRSIAAALAGADIAVFVTYDGARPSFKQNRTPGIKDSASRVTASQWAAAAVAAAPAAPPREFEQHSERTMHRVVDVAKNLCANYGVPIWEAPCEGEWQATALAIATQRILDNNSGGAAVSNIAILSRDGDAWLGLVGMPNVVWVHNVRVPRTGDEGEGGEATGAGEAGQVMFVKINRAQVLDTFAFSKDIKVQAMMLALATSDFSSLPGATTDKVLQAVVAASDTAAAAGSDYWEDHFIKEVARLPDTKGVLSHVAVNLCLVFGQPRGVENGKLSFLRDPISELGIESPALIAAINTMSGVLAKRMPRGSCPLPECWCSGLTQQQQQQPSTSAAAAAAAAQPSGSRPAPPSPAAAAQPSSSSSSTSRVQAALDNRCHTTQSTSTHWYNGPKGAVICRNCYQVWRKADYPDELHAHHKDLQGPCGRCSSDETPQWHNSKDGSGETWCKDCYLKYMYPHQKWGTGSTMHWRLPEAVQQIKDTFCQKSLQANLSPHQPGRMGKLKNKEAAEYVRLLMGRPEIEDVVREAIESLTAQGDQALQGSTAEVKIMNWWQNLHKERAAAAAAESAAEPAAAEPPLQQTPTPTRQKRAAATKAEERLKQQKEN